jgi:WD40 repeat protein
VGHFTPVQSCYVSVIVEHHAGGNPHIQIFDINSNDDKPIASYDGHTNNVTAVGFHRQLKWLYSGSEDGTVRIWDPRSNASTRTYDCGAPVNTVVLAPNQGEGYVGPLVPLLSTNFIWLVRS